MPANHKVSVAWQIVFTFLPVVNFWAFYRIRKLRMYVLYVILPSIIVSIYYISETGLWVGVPAWAAGVDQYIVTVRPADDPLLLTKIVANVILNGLQGFAIYLVIVWSRQHNRKFDTPTASSG
jgi:hypothetical protein